jgi:ribose 1,5-bisphosphokinase PhnN
MNRRLIYVVGPSGAGKDSVLSWLRQHTPLAAPVHWARRTIDRPKVNLPNAEDHFSVDKATFEQQKASDLASIQSANDDIAKEHTDIDAKNQSLVDAQEALSKSKSDLDAQVSQLAADTAAG